MGQTADQREPCPGIELVLRHRHCHSADLGTRSKSSAPLRRRSRVFPPPFRRDHGLRHSDRAALAGNIGDRDRVVGDIFDRVVHDKPKNLPVLRIRKTSAEDTVTDTAPPPPSPICEGRSGMARGCRRSGGDAPMRLMNQGGRQPPTGDTARLRAGKLWLSHSETMPRPSRQEACFAEILRLRR